MDYKFGWLFAIVVLSAIQSQAQTNDRENKTPSVPNDGTPYVEEVIVESSLNVRKKPTTTTVTRTQREAPNVVAEYILLLPINRQKRQFGGRPGFQGFQNPGFQNAGFGGFNQKPQNSNSQSSANANSNSFGYRPDGFDSANALAQAQGFQTSGPNGGFGSNAANTLTNTIHTGPDGIRGSAGISGGQTYNLPNGQTLNIAYTNGYSIGPDGRPTTSKGSSVAFT